jgi:phosphoribosylformylglycinamidine cyclo-ligase
MPGMYPQGEYDLAGFAVGVVEKSRIIDGRSIVEGDTVLGLASSGAHSNGYSLIRRILERSQPDLTATLDGQPFADAIMAPTRIYVKPVLELLKSVPVKGMAHITGGGLTENVPRILPDHLVAEIEADSWVAPALFRWLQQAGNVEPAEMYRTFNCGIGFVIVVDPIHADAAIGLLAGLGEKPFRIGHIRARRANEPQTLIV